MKKILISIFGLFLFVNPVWSVDFCTGDASNINHNQLNSERQTSVNSDYDKQDADDFYNELIQQDYGSNQSADFNNNSEMNPNESDYAYEGAGSAE